MYLYSYIIHRSRNQKLNLTIAYSYAMEMFLESKVKQQILLSFLIQYMYMPSEIDLMASLLLCCFVP